MSVVVSVIGEDTDYAYADAVSVVSAFADVVIARAGRYLADSLRKGPSSAPLTTSRWGADSITRAGRCRRR